MQWTDIQTRVSGLLQYLWQGKSHYHIHSPFVFDLVNKVLRDKRNFYDLELIEQKRIALLDDNTPLDIKEVTLPDSGLKRTSVAALARKTAIPSKYGQLLFRLANHYRAKQILEIGTGIGISTSYLACSNRKGRMISLEGDPARAAIAKKLLHQLNCSSVEVREGNFEVTLPDAVHDLGNIDLVFMDGNHQLDATLHYFETILPALHENSLVVVDDIYWSADMELTWQQLQQHSKVSLSIDLYRLGLLFFTPDFVVPQHHRLYY